MKSNCRETLLDNSGQNCLGHVAARGTSRTDRAARGTLTSFLQYGVQILLQIAIAPLVLKMAGKETLGAYAILMQLLWYLNMVDLGLSASLCRFLAQAHGRDDGGRRFGNILTTGRTFLFGSNIVFAVLVLILSSRLGLFFSLTGQMAAEVRLGLFLLAGWAVVRTPWTIFVSGLVAVEDLATANFIGIIGNTSRIILSVGLVMTGAGLVGLVSANILAEAVITVLSRFRFRRLHPALNPEWGIPDRSLLREMLTFGFQLMLMNIGWRLVYCTDNVVVGYLYGAAAASIYYTTQMPATMAFMLVNRLAENAAPGINNLYAKTGPSSLIGVFLKLHRYNMFLALPFVGGVLLLNRQLVELWVGAGQYAGDMMTFALAAYIFMNTVTFVGYQFIQATGRIKMLSLICLSEGIVNLALSLWLGRRMGLPGVMVATVIANIGVLAYVQYRSMADYGVRPAQYLSNAAIPAFVPALLSFALAWLVSKALSCSGWLSFGITGSVLVGAHALLVYFISLDAAERIWLRVQLQRVLFAVTGRQAARGSAD